MDTEAGSGTRRIVVDYGVEILTRCYLIALAVPIRRRRRRTAGAEAEARGGGGGEPSSHLLPMPSLSRSFWFELGTSGQLSDASGTPSPSLSPPGPGPPPLEVNGCARRCGVAVTRGVRGPHLKRVLSTSREVGVGLWRCAGKACRVLANQFTLERGARLVRGEFESTCGTDDAADRGRS